MLKGAAGAAGLLALYVGVTTVISGLGFMAAQFAERWYWIVGLAVGFGTQVGLVAYLRALHVARVSRAVAAVSGTTSGAAMLACCSHYLANVIPLIGVSGIAALIGQYQTELFVFGAAVNLIGIGYVVRKLVRERAAYGTPPTQ